MELSELMDQLLEIMPNAIFDTDANGEIIVATGFVDSNGVLVSILD